jgi:CRISPR-associated protein Csb1
MTTSQSLTAETINAWADDTQGPVALILKQRLLPVDGEGGIIFPPTYANIGYSIDTLADGTKVAQIDSVPSQANRREPLFRKDGYKHLVPQIEIDLGKSKDGDFERRVSLLDLAHRAGDAVVRSSDLAKEIDAAFKTLLRSHDAGPLAKLAPTSLIFGVWDSRGTQAKLPRLVRSVIRAEDVQVLHGAAQYNSIWKLLSDEQKQALEDDPNAGRNGEKLAEVGFKDVPAIFRKTDDKNDEARVLGGVIARGPITCQITINFIALRSICGADANSTKNLRRYLLGLALMAATADLELYLREGCLLRYADDDEEPWEAVPRRGKSTFFCFSSEKDKEIISSYAKQVADTFGVEKPKNERFVFDIDKAKALLEPKKGKKADGKGATRKKGKKGDELEHVEMDIEESDSED